MMMGSIDNNLSLPRQELYTLFKIFDVRKTGRIEILEAKAALRALDIFISITEIQAYLYNQGFAPNSKYLTFEMFIALVESQLPLVNSLEAYKQLFVLFTGDEDSFITYAKLSEICEALNEKISDDDLKNMIKCADKDDDGKISLQEFVNLMESMNLQSTDF